MNHSARANTTVLVVEDNVDAREVFAFSLRAMGYQVREADNGQHALDSVRLATPDVILSDLRMPSMNGVELAQALKQSPQYADIPIVLITATPLSDKWAALKLFVALLVKPATLDELTATIDRAAGLDGQVETA